MKKSGILMCLVAMAMVLTPAVYILLLKYTNFGCDISERVGIKSPDGLWLATWNLRGCHGLLLVTNYENSVSLYRAEAAAEPIKIFAGDSAEVPQLKWMDTKTLNIEISEIESIWASKRIAGDIRITYSITPDLRRRLPGILAESRQRQRLPNLSVSDRAAADQVDKSFQTYVARFTRWVFDFAPL